MRTLVALVLFLSLNAAPAGAQTARKPPPPLKLSLVQAQCAGLPPGPCSTLTFATGSVVLRGSKEPGPTCPKTGMVTDSPAGTATLTGVTQTGTPLDGKAALTAEVAYKTTFGPNLNCGLATVQIDTVSLLATLNCKKGRCTGTFFPIACLPPNCADTLVTTELSNLVVRDAGHKDLARPGTFIPPAAADAR
jgi:hypothetical protein